MIIFFCMMRENYWKGKVMSGVSTQAHLQCVSTDLLISSDSRIAHHNITIQAVCSDCSCWVYILQVFVPTLMFITFSRVFVITWDLLPMSRAVCYELFHPHEGCWPQNRKTFFSSFFYNNIYVPIFTFISHFIVMEKSSVITFTIVFQLAFFFATFETFPW